MLNNDVDQPLPAEPETTGKILVLFEQHATEVGSALLSDAGGLDVVSTSDIGASEANPNLEDSSALVYDNLGLAIINATSDQLGSINSASADEVSSPIITMEAERVVYTQITNAVVDESAVTWGLVMTKVINCNLTGRGVRVAILDTGFDLNHPDFVGRTIVHESFVDGEDVQDGHGHGTHCTGTACGPRQPDPLPRYGVACEADIYIGKVLNNAKGKGTDGTIIAGINWAVEQACQVVSMSIGGRTIVGQPYSQIFEVLAQRALAQGTLIIAAAGNDSRRLINGAIYNPVSHPANCPSIMAVGALDSQLQVGWFSNRGLNPDGGGLDIAAPGMAVYSSWPMPVRYKTIDGTSMATPHTAGIAALLAEAYPDARGKALWDLLIQYARPLSDLAVNDVGAGLVQVP